MKGKELKQYEDAEVKAKHSCATVQAVVVQIIGSPYHEGTDTKESAGPYLRWLFASQKKQSLGTLLDYYNWARQCALKVLCTPTAHDVASHGGASATEIWHAAMHGLVKVFIGDAAERHVLLGGKKQDPVEVERRYRWTITVLQYVVDGGSPQLLKPPQHPSWDSLLAMLSERSVRGSIRSHARESFSTSAPTPWRHHQQSFSHPVKVEIPASFKDRCGIWAQRLPELQATLANWKETKHTYNIRKDRPVAAQLAWALDHHLDGTTRGLFYTRLKIGKARRNPENPTDRGDITQTRLFVCYLGFNSEESRYRITVTSDKRIKGRSLSASTHEGPTSVSLAVHHQMNDLLTTYLNARARQVRLLDVGAVDCTEKEVVSLFSEVPCSFLLMSS